MGVSVHGCKGIWCMGAWVHGCMGAWVHGCRGAGVQGYAAARLKCFAWSSVSISTMFGRVLESLRDGSGGKGYLSTCTTLGDALDTCSILGA